MAEKRRGGDPLPGAEPLRAYIDRLDKSVPEWCEDNGLDRFTIQRLLNGELQRVSVELAFDIEQATSEEVEWSLWVPDEDIRNEQKEKRRAAARERARVARIARQQEREQQAGDGGR